MRFISVCWRIPACLRMVSAPFARKARIKKKKKNGPTLGTHGLIWANIEESCRFMSPLGKMNLGEFRKVLGPWTPWRRTPTIPLGCSEERDVNQVTGGYIGIIRGYIRIIRGYLRLFRDCMGTMEKIWVIGRSSLCHGSTSSIGFVYDLFKVFMLQRPVPSLCTGPSLT